MSAKPARSDKMINVYLDIEFAQRGITQSDLQKVLGRSQGYVSERRSCKRSWTMRELDEIAPLVGLADSLALVTVIMGLSMRHGEALYGA